MLVGPARHFRFTFCRLPRLLSNMDDDVAVVCAPLPIRWTTQHEVQLVEAVHQRHAIIFGAFSTSITRHTKTQAWQEVTDNVNSISISFPKQTAKKVEKKFQNMRDSAKRKARKSKDRGTGGGPPPKITFSSAEELILNFIREHQAAVLDGIAGGVESGGATPIGNIQLIREVSASDIDPQLRDLISQCVESGTGEENTESDPQAEAYFRQTLHFDIDTQPQQETVCQQIPLLNVSSTSIPSSNGNVSLCCTCGASEKQEGKKQTRKSFLDERDSLSLQALRLEVEVNTLKKRKLQLEIEEMEKKMKTTNSN